MNKLRDISSLPLEGSKISPMECYLVGSDTPKIIPYVDFEAGAGPFLNKCGSREIPNASEIAKLLFKNPSTFES